MTPTLRPGDRLLVRYGAPLGPGDLVVARFADGTVAVKRAERLTERGWWLTSDNPDAGVDSRHRGAVGADSVLAVVRARVWPRPSRLHGRP